MNNSVKNVAINTDSNVQNWMRKLTQQPLVSEEELIAIRLEYLDVTPEDWKVHLEQSN
jgi:hypothetical protein